ncbi:MAG: hypothetical protein ACR2IE_14195 [Candidatus Sumerlaeaceae bacterium]
MAASIFNQIKDKEDVKEAVALMAIGLAEMAKELEQMHATIRKLPREETQAPVKPKPAV